MAKVSQGTDPFSDVTQLSVTYRGSSLSRDLREVSSVRAGDRAPDTSCLRSADGSLTRLFNLFQGTHFTLLAFSDHPFAEDLHADHDLLHVYTIARASTESALRDAAAR